MKKAICCWIGINILFMSLVSEAKSKCDYKIDLDGDTYCMKVEWAKTTVKKRGEFKSSSQFSPYYIKGQLPASRWNYSNATIKIWHFDDAKELSVELEESFRVFPFMEMLNGHGHGDSHRFYWDAKSRAYRLEELALHEMEGCWSLRWTKAATDSVKNSALILKIKDYTNLNPGEKVEIINYCEICRAADHKH